MGTQFGTQCLAHAVEAVVSLTWTDGGIERFVTLAARKEIDTIIALQLDSPANTVQLAR